MTTSGTDGRGTTGSRLARSSIWRRGAASRGRPSTAGINARFAALVVAQAAHSAEEYAGRLWESFPPAAYLTGLVSADRERAFLMLNGAIVAFGMWCLFWPVRQAWRSATAFVWLWIAVETVNGIGHPVWSAWRRAHTPGVSTAPFLLVLALSLAFQMMRVSTGAELE